MSENWTLEEVDADGAIQEMGEKVEGSSRSAFLRKAGIGAGAVVGGGALMGAIPSLASAGSVRSTSDVDILNYALTLEYLEAAFYNEAVSKGALKGETVVFAKTVAAHENAHVAFLKGALGAKAVAKPKFDFKGTTGEAGEVPGDGRGARVHRRRRVPGPGRQHQRARRSSAPPARSCRSRRTTPPGSRTSAATAPHRAPHPRVRDREDEGAGARRGQGDRLHRRLARR